MSDTAQIKMLDRDHLDSDKMSKFAPLGTIATLVTAIAVMAEANNKAMVAIMNSDNNSAKLHLDFSAKVANTLTEFAEKLVGREAQADG